MPRANVQRMAVSLSNLREVRRWNKPVLFASLAAVHTLFLLYLIVTPDLYTITRRDFLNNQSLFKLSKNPSSIYRHSSSSLDALIPTRNVLNQAKSSPLNKNYNVALPSRSWTSLPFKRRPLRYSQSPSHIYFRPHNRDLEQRFRELLSTFDRLMSENGLTYFLYGGTLIGSYRHHGPIPWDDDLDVIAPVSQRPLIQQILSRISPDFLLTIRQRCYWKLFSSHSNPISKLPWKWPFLDIFFYDENSTHIWDICPYYRDRYRYNKAVVFPLRRRPFLDLALFAPHDPLAVIEETYKIHDCQSSHYIHRLERSSKFITVPCSELHSLHPFVSRTYMNDGCNETLVQGGNITKVFFDLGVTC